RAAEPRIAYLEWLARRGGDLIRRLQRLGARVPTRRVDAAQSKLAHLELRLRLPIARPRRLWPVSREALAGRYARYSMGLHAVAYDLLGKG
ncbi:MAG: hypothetical protein ACREP1_10075, partial [Rhodanobacteraceae bacterium]